MLRSLKKIILSYQWILYRNAAINRITGNSTRELVRPSSFATTLLLVRFTKTHNEIMIRIPGVDRKPADVYIPNWAAGRDAALDVTVVNPLQKLESLLALPSPPPIIGRCPQQLKIATSKV